VNILVSGVGGLLGSWMSEALAREGHRVIGVDDFSGGTLSNAQEAAKFSNHYRFIELDVTNREKMVDLAMGERPEVVVHAAACAREGASPFQPLKIIKTNIEATTSILEACIKNGLRKFVYFSSMSVAGDNKVPFTEDQSRNPVDIYGTAKAACELTIEQLAKVHGFDYTILRPHNCVGPRQLLTDPYRNVCGIVMNRIMNKLPIFLYGEGHIRAFSYVADFLPAMVRACDLKTANGEIIYIGGKEQVTVEEMVNVIVSEFGDAAKTSPIVRLPPRPLEVQEAWCSTKKSEKLLGYKETIGWREGIHHMAEWAKKVGPQPWRIDTLPLLTEAAPLPWRELARGHTV
jgi:nucleoside-diphosphate-sugar epimerase